MKTVQNTIHL